MNRASDDSDSELEDRLVRRSYLTERVKNRALHDELAQTEIGMKLLIGQRELAMYEAKRRPGFDQEIFDDGYPPYKWNKRKRKKLRVQVSDVIITKDILSKFVGHQSPFKKTLTFFGRDIGKL